MAILENITRRKETEKELKCVNQQMEQQLIEIQLLENQLREQANRDVLTGVYNRGYLEETPVREISRAARRNSSLSVIMIDVDNFKWINDTFGHKTGDEEIIALGKLLQDQTRDCDLSAVLAGMDLSC